MDQVVDIATDGIQISRSRGFLVASKDGREVGRTQLDQVSCVIVHAHGTAWTTSALADLADRGVPVVICGVNHFPRSVVLPIDGYFAQGRRVQAQWDAKMIHRKQAWKQVVISKVKMQASALESVGAESARLSMLARKVLSGDTTNIEAQSAKFYWPRLMGKEFRRDRRKLGANSLLNYGYTVIRATAARAVLAAGLHPSIGIHHSNRGNSFALADDLVEPFRPIVDCVVRRIVEECGPELTSDAKRRLARVIAIDVQMSGKSTPVALAMIKCAASLGNSFEQRKICLDLPDPMRPLDLSGVGAG